MQNDKIPLSGAISAPFASSVNALIVSTRIKQYSLHPSCCILLHIAIFCGFEIGMHKTARQKLLMELLLEQGQVGIGQLVEKLQVSADTVRRDLADLEKQGLAQKKPWWSRGTGSVSDESPPAQRTDSRCQN